MPQLNSRGSRTICCWLLTNIWQFRSPSFFVCFGFLLCLFHTFQFPIHSALRWLARFQKDSFMNESLRCARSFAIHERRRRVRRDSPLNLFVMNINHCAFLLLSVPPIDRTPVLDPLNKQHNSSWEGTFRNEYAFFSGSIPFGWLTSSTFY